MKPETKAAERPPQQLSRVLAQGVAVLAALVSLAPGLTSPLTHYDDPLYLDRIEVTKPGADGWGLLLRGDSAWSGEFVEFFPLRDSIYRLIFQQWHKAPLPYHLASLFFHLVATLLVFRFVEKLQQRLWVTAAATLLFAVHPIHIESVVWVAGLKDPLYTCFLLGSLIAYCEYRARQTPGRYALAVAMLVCGLWVKAMALSIPLLMLALERLAGPPSSWKTIFKRLAGPAVICALFLVQFVLLGRINHVRTTLHQGTWVGHIVLTAWAQVVYFRQTFFPASFRLIYCFAPVDSYADWRLLAAGGLAGAVVAAVVFWRRQPMRLLCLAIHFACLLPVSNLLPFSAVLADRYLYAASIGSCLLIALLLDGARPRLKNTVLALTVVGLASTTALRSSIWQDEESLWAEADEDPICLRDPEFPAADTHFLRYLAAKDINVRIAALKRLLTHTGPDNDSFGLRCEALLMGAPLLEELGDHDEAERWARLGWKHCRGHSAAPRAVLMVAMHHDLKAAIGAADRWYRMAPLPEMNLFRWLTRLEVADEPATREEIAKIVLTTPDTCPILLQWYTEVGPALREAVAPGVQTCQSNLH